jgi:hypothetical protein
MTRRFLPRQYSPESRRDPFEVALEKRSSRGHYNKDLGARERDPPLPASTINQADRAAWLGDLTVRELV